MRGVRFFALCLLLTAGLLVALPTRGLAFGSQGQGPRARHSMGRALRFEPGATEEPGSIHFSNGFSINTHSGVTDVPDGLRADASTAGPQLSIIQFTGPVNRSWRRQLERTGIPAFGYLAPYATMAMLDAAQRERVTALPFVRWVGPFHPGYKLQQHLLYARGEMELDLLLTPFGDEATVANVITAFNGTVDYISRSGFGTVIRFRLATDRLASLAGLDDVLWIQEWTEPDICNNNIQWVTQTGWQATAPPDTAMLPRNVWRQGIRGRGIILSSTDTGLNTGHDMFRDPALPITPPGIWPGHRKVVAFKLYQGAHAGESPRHGTHVNGTIAGCDSVTGGTSFYDGAAKDARLYFVDVSNSSGGFVIGSDLTALWDTVYLGRGLPDSVRPVTQHSGSWGWSNSQGTYLLMDASTDAYCWANKDFLNIMAAGNEYNALRLRNPGIAKNVLTVGATQNGILSNAIASFSSRGPTQDNRTKPNVVAPGAAIWSARMAPETNTYEQLSGTSMATPAVNGVVGLMRQYLREGYYPTGTPEPEDEREYISAALLRTMAMVSADPNVGSFTVPDNNIGWGRVDADSVLYFPGQARRLLIMDDTTGLATGEYKEHKFQVNSAIPLRAMLAWTDTAAAPNANPTLVNNLHLELTSPSGTQYRGNQFTSGQSTPNPGSWDNINVEEGFRVNAPETGEWTLRVYGQNVATAAKQPFAVVVTGDIAVVPAPVLSGLNPTSGNKLWTGGVVFTGENFLAPATANFGADITVNSVTVASPTQLTANITITAGAATGPRNVTVTTAGGTSNALTFTVTNPAPTLASINPTAGNRLQTLTVTFSGTSYIQDVTTVDFGAGITVNSVTVAGPTQLTANITIAAGAATGPRNVSVSNPTPGGGTATLTNAFTVNNPAPTLTGILPTSGNRLWTGDVVFTGGNYIQDVTTVDFGAGITVNSVTVAGPTQLTANITIAAGAATGPRNVSVSNPTPGGGTATLTNAFTVNNPAPTLASISPTSGNRLQTLTVTFAGTNYIQDVTTVDFGAGITVNSITVAGPTQLTADIAIAAEADTGPRNVSVSNAAPGGGTATLTNAFTVTIAGPTISALDPDIGVRLWAGEVTFSGSNYVEDVTSVDFGENITINSVIVASPTQLTADVTIAAEATTGPRAVSVTTPGGTATIPNGFSVSNPAPLLAALAPTFGMRLGSVQVELTGAGFLADISSAVFGPDITVNSVTVAGPTQLTASITIAAEAATGPRDVSVVNAAPGGGSATLGDAFLVENPVPVLTGITPSAGRRPDTLDVTLTGTGFFADASSADFGPDITVFSLAVTSPTQLVASITIAPAAALGPRPVVVRNAAPGGGDAGPVMFTVFEASPWHDYPGWHEVAPIPAQAGNRRDMPHRGAWLAVGPAPNGVPAIYAAKGNKLQSFYRYDPVDDAWTGLAPVPFDPARGRPLRQGARAASDGDNSIFVVHGNNTAAFWRYDIAVNEWAALPCVPDGPSGRRVRGGGDLLYIDRADTGWVYLLKGDRDEFWRYNTESRVWAQLPTPPPGVRNRWQRDSWLAFDGEDAVYAHKARYFDRTISTHDFYRYSLSRNAWDTLRPAGMPLYGLHSGRIRPKPARDGGAGAFDDGAVYALKGGNTQQFWRYDVATNHWAEADTMPSFSPLTPRRRRVNAGADLVHYRQGLYSGFFALKGNKTQEFWRYVVPLEVGAGLPARPERGGVMARPGGKLLPGLLVGPSPARDEVVLYAGNTAGPVRAELVSALGVVLAERTVLPHDRARIPVGHLPAGSYFIRVRDGETTVTRKVVIGR